MVLPAALALLASSALIAQSRFRADVDLVSLAVTIAHDEGQPVTDLEQHDFEIYEDGQLQSVRYFARGAESGKEVPLRLALLFDTSGSMGQDIRLSRTSAIKFLNAMPHAEDMTLVEFDTEVRLSRYSQDDFARSSSASGDESPLDSLRSTMPWARTWPVPRNSMVARF
jgi:VWFA-related protein